MGNKISVGKYVYPYVTACGVWSVLEACDMDDAARHLENVCANGATFCEVPLSDPAFEGVAYDDWLMLAEEFFSRYKTYEV